ncbi:hypothetical protein QFC22_002085 [Naganishia vaughanmartiniae]|uniref:Uncharacterized protein n=1 Tax=Naganishia vaughanmartiniae TaxID=1424756 RepID=A0ACC2XDN4_9TREE|nr:hypothetical protein QFC22_002085 [Naganishia vaughanmartiniae]
MKYSSAFFSGLAAALGATDVCDARRGDLTLNNGATLTLGDGTFGYTKNSKSSVVDNSDALSVLTLRDDEETQERSVSVPAFGNSIPAGLAPEMPFLLPGRLDSYDDDKVDNCTPVKRLGMEICDNGKKGPILRPISHRHGNEEGISKPLK